VKLLAVCQVDRPGGAEIGLLRLLRRLGARGWDITITSPGEEDSPLAHAGWPWEPLELGGLAHGAGARAVGSWPRARWLARDHDVTYLNGTVAGRLLPALLGRTTVLHVHDIVDRVPRHWHRADMVLADSRAIAARLDPLDVHVLGSPVDLDPPPIDRPWNDGTDRPVIGFVGRLEARKGPLDLCLAVPLIKARRPDARILIIGDDVHAQDAEYAARVIGAPGVEHVPWVNDAAALMRHLDVLVHPSRQEPFSTVLGEAMAAGTPVVATNVDSLPEVVEDGVTGRLVGPGDIGALADAVVEVLDRREEMGAAARVAAAERFDADHYTDTVEALLRRAAGR
jgi:glycosyltransferase involved in cell wall biosynthesis